MENIDYRHTRPNSAPGMDRGFTLIEVMVVLVMVLVVLAMVMVMVVLAVVVSMVLVGVRTTPDIMATPGPVGALTGAQTWAGAGLFGGTGTTGGVATAALTTPPPNAWIVEPMITNHASTMCMLVASKAPCKWNQITQIHQIN